MADSKQAEGYRAGELIWLLGLNHDDAIEQDSSPGSALRAGDDLSSNAEESVPAIARWADAQRAKKMIVREKREQMILELRGAGFGEEEIAEMVGLTRSTTRRRFKARVRDMLDFLGRAVGPERLDHVDLCLTCNERPRIRLAEVRAENWTLLGRRRDERGILRQAWLDSSHRLVLRNRPLTRSARIGAVREVIITQGVIVRHRDRPELAFGEEDQRVRAWVYDDADSARAEPGEPVILRGAALHGRGGSRVVHPEKQSSGCEVCQRPELQPRVVPRKSRT